MSPDAFNAAAATLYGGGESTGSATLLGDASSAPAAPQTADPAPTGKAPGEGLYADNEQRAESPTPAAEQPAGDIKPDIPAAVATLREAEDNGLYSRISGLDSVPLEAALESVDVAPEIKAASALEYRHMAADIGASADQAAQLLATAQTLISTPPTPEQATQMQGEAAALVVAKYGEDATKMLDLAKRMVARDPRIQSLLERTGAGNDPRTVMTMVELAVQQRSRGRLQ